MTPCRTIAATVPGGTCFFIVNLLDRNSRLHTDRIDAFQDAVRDARARAPFHIDAWAVLPEHMHCVWTLPPGAVKKAFSKAIAPGEWSSTAPRARDESGIWQRRFWEHTIRDDEDYARHVDYVHFNRVKHGLVEEPAAWP